MKVKTILVSQPEPKVENSPYFDLIDRQKVKMSKKSEPAGWKSRKVTPLIN